MTLPTSPRHVAVLPWGINNSNFCTCGIKHKQTAFLITSNFVIHPQISILSVFSESFQILIANKILHVIVLLFIYFCDQFVAPEIHHSRCHCSVCQQSTWYPATRTLWQKVCVWRGTQQRGWQTNLLRKAGQIGALKMQFVCIFFNICWIYAENLNF